jgi:hypothetical protein
LLVSIAACEESPTAADSPTAVEPNLVITPPGPNAWDCIDPEDPHYLPGPGGDPYPDSAGVWLGTVGGGQQVSFLWCTNFGSDTDADGVAEFCENKLAESFRPLMISYEFDEVDGEPYYAVKEGPGNRIRIMYMLAYYKDLGDCNAAGYCSGGHAGDSEFVVVDVSYNSATSHWIFVKMAPSSR